MSATKNGNPKRAGSSPVEKLGPQEFTLLGKLTCALLGKAASKPFSLPSPLAKSSLLSDVLSSAMPDLLKLGEGIAALALQQEGDVHQRPQKLDFLFWEALIDAIEILESRQHLHEFRQKQGQSQEEEVQAVMREVASRIIDTVFSEEFSIPSQADQWACIDLALALDSRCSDAYFIVGSLQEKAGRHQLALIAYRTAMQLAAEAFGGEEELMKRDKQEVGLWYELEGRDYLRPRAALAALLWRLEKYPQAIAHYQATLKLNPSDNQGNRHALLCLLLEAGDDEALAGALTRFHFSDCDTAEPQDIAGTTWHYTNACWLYRRVSSGANTQEATQALQAAFKHNRYVPYMLLAPEGLPGLDSLSAYAKGDATEAATYVNMALKGWQRTPGALDWLEETARQTRLFRTGKGEQGLIVPRMTIHVIAEKDESR